jgi:hypothetical protein
VDRELRLSFRGTFSPSMMQVWSELCAVVEQVCLNDDSDSLVWCYTKYGVYSSQPFHSVISFRGVTPVYLPATWNIVVPLKNSFVSLAFV